MDRKGAYLKPGTRATAPGVLFTVVVRPHVNSSSKSDRVHVRTFAEVAATVVKYRRGRWNQPELVTFQRPEELWIWMHQRAERNRRNYVVCPVASDVLTLTNWWNDAESTGVEWAPAGSKDVQRDDRQTDRDVVRFRRFVTRGCPDILDYTRTGIRWIWLSGRQYFPGTEGDIATSIGFKWCVSGVGDRSGATRVREVGERALLWSRAITRLADWWRSTARAPWGMTIGQMSVGILRTHIKRGELCSHNDPAVHSLEREGSFGGRASVWYVGTVSTPGVPSTIPRGYLSNKYSNTLTGPVFNLDVRSLYPWLLKQNVYPVRLLSYRENVRPTEPQELSRAYGVIACVRIRTYKPEYPCRDKDRIIYPVGEFDTVLTGPELLRLKDDGKVLTCHRMAIYQSGRPFARAAEELISLRTSARRAGNAGDELFAKLLGNSLAGKLAQRKGRWIERRRVCSEKTWGEWTTVDADSGEVRRFRSIAGLTWEWSQDESKSGPFTAAFAYLTAYGRLHMRAIREVCPNESVVSQDTDGLWGTVDAVSAIRESGFEFGDKAGQLRRVDVSSSGRWFGPKHYWVDSGWTLAGFSHPTFNPDHCTITDTFERNPISQSPTGPPTAVFSIVRRSKLKPQVDGGMVDPFGWVHPPFRPQHSTSG